MRLDSSTIRGWWFPLECPGIISLLNGIHRLKEGPHLQSVPGTIRVAITIKKPVTGATGNLNSEISNSDLYSAPYLFRRHIKIPQRILQAAQVDLEHLRVPVHGIVVTE